MKDKEKVDIMFDASPYGVISSSTVTQLGLHRSILQELVDEGEIYLYSRGIYLKKDAWEDEFYLLQQKYKKGIFSHDTALYLLGYTDRTPIKYTMTFPQGYNAKSLKNENVIIKRAIPKNYSLGISEIKSPSGNTILIYDLERTLCDVVRGQGSDIQIVNDAMKRYASSNNKDIHKLMNYAEKLNVKKKIMNYMEVLL